MLDLQHTAMDIICIFGQEFLDVVAVNLKPATVSIIRADWLEAAQITKTYPSDRGPDR
jgi:hypothetical protein